MPLTFNFPTSAEVKAIGPVKIARDSQERLGLKILPMRDVNAAMVEWTQKDNFFGVQQLRGLGGAPSYVKPIGRNKYRYEPGYYGEYEVIEEAELTLKSGSVDSGSINMAADVMERQDQLIQRELDRIEYIIWKLLTAGTFTITGPNGVTFTDTFSVQTYSGSDWSTAASGTPLLDLRTIRATKGIGKGLNFGRGAMAIMNSVTSQYMLDNSNAADLGGKTTLNGGTLNDMGDVNRILAGNDVPTIMEYNEGYYDDNNTWQYYVPTDKVIVVGARRNGEQIGEYIKTRHMIDGGGVGSWMFSKDFVNGINAPKEVPSRYEIHAGHQGGPVLYHPGAVVVASV
jgi:hypothetical protein